jgi:hypothetical protein
MRGFKMKTLWSSLRSLRALSCRSFCQSFTDPTTYRGKLWRLDIGRTAPTHPFRHLMGLSRTDKEAGCHIWYNATTNVSACPAARRPDNFTTTSTEVRYLVIWLPITVSRSHFDDYGMLTPKTASFQQRRKVGLDGFHQTNVIWRTVST